MKNFNEWEEYDDETVPDDEELDGSEARISVHTKNLNDPSAQVSISSL